MPRLPNQIGQGWGQPDRRRCQRRLAVVALRRRGRRSPSPGGRQCRWAPLGQSDVRQFQFTNISAETKKQYPHTVIGRPQAGSKLGRRYDPAGLAGEAFGYAVATARARDAAVRAFYFLLSDDAADVFGRLARI